ncbi:MAG: hypothetical protein KKB81_03810 [Candidatus Margulisbacteria bacterium]|nr:hypothetical protein [Candidatus Margulisiibacteriota bacterium]MBU1021671.1 hypothetical protein [Candidatus Margulisiibacteriota bacterium]MBU1729549.1 hypothetical protein [Candidatus Margulisiibacteriota bacterium]MBU1955035.1 hypothetical protein [Candidatus Margulisiibacteriota bacterium]
MANPIYDSAINRAGLQEQSAAANAAMIITGLERELNAKKVKIVTKEPKIEFEKLTQYIQKLVDSPKVDKVKRRKPRDEDKEGALESFVKSGAALLRRRGKRAYPYLKKGNPRLILKAGEIDAFTSLKNIDPKLLKEYAVLEARYHSKTPQEKMNEIEKRLIEIEATLAKQGLRHQTLETIKNRIDQLVDIELADLIKERLHQDLSNPSKSLKTIIMSKSALKLLGFLFHNEATHEITSMTIKAGSPMDRILQSITYNSIPEEAKNTNALLNFARELNIDLTPWIAKWNFEKVNIGENGKITINTEITDAIREVKLLLDEYKLLESRKLLEPRLISRLFLYWRLKELEEDLKDRQVLENEILNAREQARHIAWLKIVAILKEYHLKRVFCGSQKEFNMLSQVIEYLTNKAHKLGTHISEEGINLLHTELGKLAYKTATYKLELLQSMQKIAPSENNEKDIKWLTAVLRHLQGHH